MLIAVPALLPAPVHADQESVAPLPIPAWMELPEAPGRRALPLAGIRGITVGPIESSQHPNRGYGSDASLALLDHLVAMGTNWISITPFGRVWSLDDPYIRHDFEAPFAENREGITTFIKEARARGLRVLLIPHLWVETSGWRGEIDHSPENWPIYQQEYRDFVLTWADIAEAAGADALSVGVECKSWSGRFGGFWTELIGTLRSRFGGLLTYSANWDEVENVLFWDQLDFIGINAFYPLAQENGASDAEYLAGARRWIPELAHQAEVLDMPILFVEVGYTTRTDAAVEPWLWPDGMENVVIDEREQARALQAMFDAFLPEDFFAGFFVWRYYANLDDVTQEAIWGFSPHAKLAEATLQATFGHRWARDQTANFAPQLPSWHAQRWLSPAPPIAWQMQTEAP